MAPANRELLELFNKATGADLTEQKLTSHDFRRRAITLFAIATGSVDATQQTFNLDPQTARKYYLDAGALDGRKVLAGMAGILLPKK